MYTLVGIDQSTVIIASIPRGITRGPLRFIYRSVPDGRSMMFYIKLPLESLNLLMKTHNKPLYSIKDLSVLRDRRREATLFTVYLEMKYLKLEMQFINVPTCNRNSKIRLNLRAVSLATY